MSQNLSSAAVVIGPLRKYKVFNFSTLPLCILDNSACFFSSVDFYPKKLTFWKKFFQEYYQSAKQFGSIVVPDMDVNCLQRLSADNKIPN